MEYKLKLNKDKSITYTEITKGLDKITTETFPETPLRNGFRNPNHSKYTKPKKRNKKHKK